ncbi:MAG: YkgJ family cysteine cluster protein [Candidatus Heimdallarchaeota archaeon]
MYIELPVITSGIEIGTVNLRKDVVSIQGANLIRFTCDSRVDCCSKLKIPVTEFDIQRIENKGYEMDQIISSLSPIILPARTFGVQKEKVYTLKRKPFDGTCTFLENNLCSIHEFKPFACQIYPFSLEIIDSEEIKIVVHTEEICKSIKSSYYLDSDNISLLKSILKNIKAELNARNIPI